MKAIDAHCHLHQLSVSEFKENLHAVDKLVLVGTCHKDWLQQIELQKHFPNDVFLGFGIHPWRLSEMPKDSLSKEYDALNKSISKCHFVGETGLDGHGKWNKTLQQQLEGFKTHINLSLKYQKPLILHCVKAETNMLRVLESVSQPLSGFVHSYQGTWQQAERFIALGLYLSFGPSILKFKSKKAEEVLHNISLDHILLESDAPDQAKGSGVVQAVARKIAESKQVPLDKVIEVSAKNFHTLVKGAYVVGNSSSYIT